MLCAIPNWKWLPIHFNNYFTGFIYAIFVWNYHTQRAAKIWCISGQWCMGCGIKTSFWKKCVCVFFWNNYYVLLLLCNYYVYYVCIIHIFLYLQAQKKSKFGPFYPIFAAMCGLVKVRELRSGVLKCDVYEFGDAKWGILQLHNIWFASLYYIA